MDKKHYKFGDYYSPLDLVKIAIKKLKRKKWSVLLLPISAALFIFNLILSIILYPIFFLNKLLCGLGIQCTKKMLPLAIIATVLLDILHVVFYIIYWITMPIQRLCVTVYKIFPNKVTYFSNQFALCKAKYIANVKRLYKIEFYNTIESIKKKIPHDIIVRVSADKVKDTFEEDFYNTLQKMPEPERKRVD